MDPDKFQQAWQKHSSQARVSVDADLLLKQVRRDQQEARAERFFFDISDIGFSLLMLPGWIYLGVKAASPWAWYLMVPVFIWSIGFTLVVRACGQRKQNGPGEPLLTSVKQSLALVEDQIWRRRNGFWWTQSPTAIATLALLANVSRLKSRNWLDALSDVNLAVMLFVCALVYFVYRLNERVIRTDYEPRRQELLALVASLGDGASGEVRGDYPVLLSTRRVALSPRRMLVAGVCFAAILLIGVPGILFVAQWANRANVSREEPAAESSTAALRWEASQPEVKVGDQWLKLVSVDNLPTTEFVAFSQRTYGNPWRKRFEEDLAEYLAGIKHEPKETVQLVMLAPGSSTTQTLEEVPASLAQRQPSSEDVPERRHDDGRSAPRPGVPIADAQLFRSRVDEFLAAARAKAGFSGVVLVARGGRPVYERALGFSHVESKAANTPDTPFRIASLSKQFTAAAIFRLEVQGKLSIDDPVHRYLPEFADLPYRAITIHQLLADTSGLPRIPKGILGRLHWNAMSRAATPVDDYVRLAVEMPLKFIPGTDFEYSNFGYRVLAALIARVSGRDFADFMEQDVFRPLGMNDTGVARVSRPTSEARVAEGLTFLRTDLAGQPLFANGEEGRNFGTGYGSGGIYASANDLLRWDRVLAGDAFLSGSQKKRLFQPVFHNYACGWVVKKSGLDGRLYQTHNGANQGFFSQMMRLPEDDLVIIAVGNVQPTPEVDEILTQLFRLCRSLPYRDP